MARRLHSAWGRSAWESVAVLNVGARPWEGLRRTGSGSNAMENALLIGLSRQMSLRREMDVVANNIPNINTTGLKPYTQIF